MVGSVIKGTYSAIISDITSVRLAPMELFAQVLQPKSNLVFPTTFISEFLDLCPPGF